jgi:hypothetical protein
MEPNTFGVVNKRVNIDTIGATCGATETMNGERHYLLQLIALKGRPLLLGGIGRMDLDHLFGDGAKNNTTK